MAQIIVSVQMVLEEKFVYKHDVHPLRAVGTEGKSIFPSGFATTATKGWINTFEKCRKRPELSVLKEVNPKTKFHCWENNNNR